MVCIETENDEDIEIAGIQVEDVFDDGLEVLAVNVLIVTVFPRI